MKATVNGEHIEIPEGRIYELRDRIFPEADIIILDGRQIREDAEIPEDSRLFFATTPSGKGDISELITARNPSEVGRKLGGKTVGIAGAGGLGSNIATYLARSGIGKIVVCDFDRVDISNLNRQNYTMEHLGLYKVEALREVVSSVNPDVTVEIHKIKLDENSIPEIFRGCDVICEAFDRADQKVMLLCTVTEKLPGIPVILGNGMAGISDPSDMKTEQISENAYMCGDGESEMTIGIMAPRVSICAAMMANKTIQLLSKTEE